MKGDKLIRFASVSHSGGRSMGGDWLPKGFRVVGIATRYIKRRREYRVYMVCRRSP